mgnify:CR=1 FL=1
MALVESLYTVVSAGTERGLASFWWKDLIQKALERPDQVKKGNGESCQQMGNRYYHRECF